MSSSTSVPASSRRRREPVPSPKEGEKPFLLVPWSADFLDAVRAVTDEATGGRPGRAVVVFHSRPRRYLVDGYRRHAALPLLLPRVMTGQELREWCREAWTANGVQPRRADMLDRVALLWDSVARVARDLPSGSPLKGWRPEAWPVFSLGACAWPIFWKSA